MKTLLPLLAALLPGVAASAEDLAGPKPAAPHLFRVLLHVPGSPRALDDTDVVKLYCCGPQSITFETADGCIVVHPGPYTLIGPRHELQNRKELLEGPRFYDPK